MASRLFRATGENPTFDDDLHEALHLDPPARLYAHADNVYPGILDGDRRRLIEITATCEEDLAQGWFMELCDVLEAQPNADAQRTAQAEHAEAAPKPWEIISDVDGIGKPSSYGTPVVHREKSRG